MSITRENTQTSKLMISEKLYEELYSKANILYFLLNPDFEILSCNVTAKEMLGLSGNKRGGRNFLSLVESSCREATESYLEDCVRRGYMKDRESVLTGNLGRLLDVSMNGQVETDETDHPVQIRLTITDISKNARQRREKNLLDSVAGIIQQSENWRERMERVLESIQDSMLGSCAGLFLRSAGEGSTVIRSFQGSEESNTGDNFWEWSASEWIQLMNISMGCPTAVSSDSNALLVSSLSDLLLEIPTREGKDRLMSLADYESLVIIPMNTEENHSSVFIMMHEMVERWDVEDVAFLKSLISMIGFDGNGRSNPSVNPDSDVIHRLQDMPLMGVLYVVKDKIKHINAWVERFLGLSQEAIQGRNILDFFEAEYKDVVMSLKGREESDDSPRSCKATVLDNSGRSKRIECSVANISSNGEGAELWFWIDADDRKRLKQQLLQARKMESLGLLAGGIVHEFNNLLASILGYSSLLCEEVPKDTPFYDDIQQITMTSEKATELTSRLMAYAHGGAYVVDDLDVNQLVKEVAGILSRTLDKNISIRADLDSELIGVSADASQIQLAIFQVALNSRDAMPHGGKLIFQTRNITLAPGDARLRFGGNPGPYIQVTVSDNGDGMSREIKDSIFKPYFTTKDKSAGKGLGLSMVQEIVDQHGGFISVFSEKSKGTVFKIHLPGVKEQEISFDVDEEKPLLGKETILLVDGERVLRETARKMLTRYGYKVISTDTGTEAVAIYKKYKERIDLIILDLSVSGVPIEKLLEWFKKINPAVKIIATSDNGYFARVDESLLMKVSATIQKPFQARPLLESVHSVLNP